jgi:hypothetical protein
MCSHAKVESPVFAQLIKVYGKTEEGREARYSPL